MEIYDKKFVELGNGEKYAFIETGKGAPLLLIHGNMSSGCLLYTSPSPRD